VRWSIWVQFHKYPIQKPKPDDHPITKILVRTHRLQSRANFKLGGHKKPPHTLIISTVLPPALTVLTLTPLLAALPPPETSVYDPPPVELRRERRDEEEWCELVLLAEDLL
jgi:hypothetical protein